MAFLGQKGFIVLIGLLGFLNLSDNTSGMYASGMVFKQNSAEKIMLEEKERLSFQYEELMKIHSEIFEGREKEDSTVEWNSLVQYATELMQWKQDRMLLIDNWRGDFHSFKPWMKPEPMGPMGAIGSVGDRGGPGLPVVVFQIGDEIENQLNVLKQRRKYAKSVESIKIIHRIQKELLKEKASVEFSRSIAFLREDLSPIHEDDRKNWDNFEKMEILRDEHIEAEQKARHTLAQAQNVLNILLDNDLMAWRDRWKEERSAEKIEKKIMEKSVINRIHTMEEESQ